MTSWACCGRSQVLDLLPGLGVNLVRTRVCYLVISCPPFIPCTFWAQILKAELILYQES